MSIHLLSTEAKIFNDNIGQKESLKIFETRLVIHSGKEKIVFERDSRATFFVA
jgi:hypothetical protein